MPEVNYFWDEIEDNVIEEYDENGNTIVEYTTEPTLYGSVLTQDRGGQVRHYHYDGQGNTTELTDENGNVTDTREYSAFGEVTKSTGTTEFPYQWGGRWGYVRKSSNDQQMYIRHRHYFSMAGRWSSKDPLSHNDDLNSYHFVRNSPIVSVDPSGTFVWPWRIFKEANRRRGSRGPGDDSSHHCWAVCQLVVDGYGVPYIPRPSILIVILGQGIAVCGDIVEGMAPSDDWRSDDAENHRGALCGAKIVASGKLIEDCDKCCGTKPIRPAEA